MYSVTVKIEGIDRRRKSSGLLHIVIGFFLLAKGADYYKYLDYGFFLPVLPFFIVALFSLIYGFMRRRIDMTARWNYWLRLTQLVCFTALGIAFLKTGRSIDYVGVFAFAAFTILLMFSERKIFQETSILFDTAGAHIPGYYREHLVPWEDLKEVVVREDFLTLFHVHKKYLQYQVLQDLSVIEISKLNDFCKEQMGVRVRV
jgi:hypothetical protein